MIRLTAGNDTPFIWMVKLQGQPFELSGKDVKVYVINSRGEIPVASLNIEGNRVSGVFEGRYQTRLGMHSLALRVNEGRPEMKTATVANAFELVQWSADAGGSEAGDVIFAPVVITSELRIGTGGGGEGGGSYDDTAIWKAVNNKVDKVAGKGLSTNDYTNAEKSKLAGLENYDDSGVKKDIEDLSKKVEDLEQGGQGGSTPDLSGYLTKEEFNKASEDFATTEALKGKQDTIEDLDSIRSGAGKGATAVQPSTLAGYATTQQLTELSAEVGKKQDTIIDLETIRSGASKGATAIQEVKTINGQSIVGEGDIIIQGGGGGGMSTPSGDPMHYMFEAAGALYNATGSDITRIGMFDEEITHKAGYWYLNELGDITTEEMRAIYVNWRTNMSWGVYMSVNNIRTNLPFLSMTWNGIYYKPTEIGASQVFQNATMKAVSVFWPSIFNGAGTLTEMFTYMYQLDTIIGELSAATYGKTCFNAQNLRKLKVKKLKSDIYFNECKKLSKESVLYMIQNSAATSSITITLHKDVYDKLVEDADIVAALEGKNITLGLPA